MNKKQNITIIIFLLLISNVIFYLTFVSDLPIFMVTPGSAGVINSYVNLNIVDAYIENPKKEDSIKISDDGQSLSFNVYFDSADTRIIKFKIKNIGNRATILSQLSTYNPLPSSGLSVVWPVLSDVVIQHNQTSAEYSIVLNYNGIGNSTSSTLRIALNYMEYVR